MRRVLIITLFTLFFLQQGCASVRMSEDFEQGKRSFVNGEYQQALHELLPTAAYGNAEAQYAVGFIYYNGYAGQQDTESGIFWMTQSAKQNYIPAKKALTLIQNENLQRASNQTHGGCKTKPLSAMPTFTPKPIPVYKGESHLKIKTSHTLTKKDEILQSLLSTRLLPKVKKPNYALQLFGSYHKNEVKTLQLKLSSVKMTHCWHTQRNGKDWFVLTYGDFQTAHAAKSALNNLPKSLRRMNPWIRPTKQLEFA